MAHVHLPVNNSNLKITNVHAFSLVVVFLSFADEANTIHLKLNIASLSDSCTVLDHQVPVFICDKEALASSEWDITTQQVGKPVASLTLADFKTS